jgi:hypothetical protein
VAARVRGIPLVGVERDDDDDEEEEEEEEDDGFGGQSLVARGARNPTVDAAVAVAEPGAACSNSTYWTPCSWSIPRKRTESA